MTATEIHNEYRGAQFGDKRRSDRLVRIGEVLARDPDLSFPEAMASEGQLKALYRFLNNREVTFERVTAPHVRRTAQRCRRLDQVLVLHDTTAFELPGKREGLGRIHGSATGFFLHASLAVSADRTPLGLLASETLVRSGPARCTRSRSKRVLRHNPARESLRWWRGVERSCKSLGFPERAIHVMDREGDNYDLYSHLQAGGIRHVVRLAHNRNLVGREEGLKKVASRAKGVFRRKVHIGPRARPLPYDQRRHPEREARHVSLSVSAMPVELRRPTNFASGSPPSLKVNVVTATEVRCPRGCEPICWHLVTTEPIDSVEQIEAIIDAYRTRWMVEEFFKALKTGCRFERRQLESYHSLTNALGIFLPIAVRLLALRSAARAEPEAKCVSLSKRQIRLLRRHTTRWMSESPTNQEVFLALAELGGHLRSNGPPGWLVLGRALERLLLLELGWLDRSRAGRNAIDD